MASRAETRARQEALRSDVEGLRDRPGHLLPPLRELAQTYGLSINLVSRQVQLLQDEGIIHTVPRVGTFIGPPPPDIDSALVLPIAEGVHFGMIREPFETRATQLGRIPLVVSPDTLAKWEGRNDLPAIAGVFEFTEIALPIPGYPDVPRVRFGPPVKGVHTIAFDDRAGGEMLTKHLIGLGHTKVGFVGVHVPGGDARLTWSARRMQGWRDAGGRKAFLPERETALTEGRYFSDARAIVHAIEASRSLTALIIDAQEAALELLDAASPTSPIRKLAIATFDNEQLDERSSLLTTMRLPWDEVGRLAAELLVRGGDPSHNLIEMQLIARLSSLRPPMPLTLAAK